MTQVTQLRTDRPVSGSSQAKLAFTTPSGPLAPPTVGIGLVAGDDGVCVGVGDAVTVGVTGPGAQAINTDRPTTATTINERFTLVTADPVLAILMLPLVCRPIWRQRDRS